MITDYGTLKSAITDWLVRDAESLPVDDLIAFAERKMFRGFMVAGEYFPGLRTPTNERIATWAPTEAGWSSIKVPADYIESKSMFVNDLPIDRVSDLELRRRLDSAGAGVPTAFGRLGSEFYFSPPPDGPYSINLYYYADLSGTLITDTDSNELLRLAPDAYLYGALREAEPYLKNDARVATWTTLFYSALQSMNEQAKQAELSGSVLEINNPYQ